MTDHRDVIAAFADSEPVGAENLAAALAAPEGRDYLIDLLVLRGLVGDAHEAGRTARVAAAAGGLTSRSASVAGGLQPAGRSKHRALWLTAAAALLAAGVAAGFFAGRLTPGGSRAVDTRFASDAPVSVGTTTTAPAPTHVIRMEKGVAWSERSGGN